MQYQLLPFAFILGKTYLQDNTEKQSKQTNLTVVNYLLAYFMLISQTDSNWNFKLL